LGSSGSIAILLATRNGAAFLDEQLVSLAAQKAGVIDVWVSDDGSTDDTLAILAAWKERWRRGRFEVLKGPEKGFSENFRSLVTNRAIEADYYAFCDQDDIWDDDKLEKATGWIEAQAKDMPLLYCSRTMNVSQSGVPLGPSPLFARRPSFRNALVQSIAGGNTMVMNRRARSVLADASERTGFVSHDWWAYQIVTGVGGVVKYCPEPSVRYRQHDGNQVGANTSWRARHVRLKMLLRGQFSEWTAANLTSLGLCRDMLTPDARAALDLLAKVHGGKGLSRLYALKRSGAYRQTLVGNIMLWVAAAAGWM
jgi:glycosyltransferase involved in cell wall biosynthesis